VRGTPAAVTLAGLAKHFGAVRALDGVDLSIAEGEFVAILGPSGSGKSTMLGLIAGLMEPTAGRILVGGRDMTDVPPAQRDFGLVFQSYALFPNMTVRGNIAFPLAVRRLPRVEIERRVAWAIELVRLNGLEDRKPLQISGGQQQRVAIARALVFQPRLLLLDEPLAALDRKLREEVRLELRKLQRTLGVTTILVTHDQDEAMSMSDRILVLDQGRVQQVGRPDELYRRPSNRFVAGFLGMANLFTGTLQRRADSIVLDAGHGVLLPVLADDSMLDQEATVLVRPERVSLSDACQSAAGIAATVSDTVYQGEIVRYVLAIAGDRDVVVSCSDVTPRFGAGTRVVLGVQREDVWIIPESFPLPAPVGNGSVALVRNGSDDVGRT
jgi:ABC-type Fe3+/spermidine/putrescine transport system ATPase subunit